MHWGHDGWRSVQDVATVGTGLGFYAATLDTSALPAGTQVDFTWRRQDTGEWTGRDDTVAVVPSAPQENAAPAQIGVR